ncbi:MAG: hypothetical protein H0W68_10480 [Gemmatimonadaceae bacterium]|nr:hypothetical protein [Gemmatimonadaceae bacterium]
MTNRRSSVVTGVTLALLLGVRAEAQHDGHGAAAATRDSAAVVHVMLQAIPLITRAAPTALGRTRTQALVTQPILMGHWATASGALALDGTLEAEGLTMPNGELNTGAYGEGFFDRRHPHTYLHEFVGSVRRTIGGASLSASAGRGFAPFGTDDPMMRPFVKYPVNHHLSQILERAVAIGAVRAGALSLEGGLFGGDEPTAPSDLPVWRRFGDSWSARATLFPLANVELQGSYARVASPEQPSGHGLDQQKLSYSGRSITSDGARYFLGEWARTIERDHSRNADVYGVESALVEGAMILGQLGVALRLEQTDRPEEERDADPFRTPRPSSDLSIAGVTRWRVVTVSLSGPVVGPSHLSGVPFVEVARLAAAPRSQSSVLTPDRLYGTTRLWMATIGVRLRAGSPHARMGRYGVALERGPPLAVIGGGRAGQDSAASHAH